MENAMTDRITPGTAADLRETVRSRYAAQALKVQDAASCCAPTCCGDELKSDSCCVPACCGDDIDASQITSNLYSSEQVAVLPDDAVRASLGCGNPTALASLQPGESVLDLGSGGGIDVLLS